MCDTRVATEGDNLYPLMLWVKLFAARSGDECTNHEATAPPDKALNVPLAKLYPKPNQV